MILYSAFLRGKAELIEEIARIWTKIHELERARGNFYRKGIIINRDPKTHRCRVRFPDNIDPTTMKPLESGWYQVVAHKTHNDKEYWLPDLNEMVFCLTLSESHEEGIILGSAYNTQDKPPSYANGDIYIIQGNGANRWEFLGHRNCNGKAKIRFKGEQVHIFHPDNSVNDPTAQGARVFVHGKVYATEFIQTDIMETWGCE